MSRGEIRIADEGRLVDLLKLATVRSPLMDK